MNDKKVQVSDNNNSVGYLFRSELNQLKYFLIKLLVLFGSVGLFFLIFYIVAKLGIS